MLVKDNSVRGAMLQTAFEFLLAYSEKSVINKSYLASWRSIIWSTVSRKTFLVFFLN